MSKKGRQGRQKQLLRLFAENPHCRACGKLTRVVQAVRHKTDPKDKAVLQHIYTRLMPERKGGQHGEQLSELMCRACADAYGNGIQDLVPIEELRQRSKHMPG